MAGKFSFTLDEYQEAAVKLNCPQKLDKKLLGYFYEVQL